MSSKKAVRWQRISVQLEGHTYSADVEIIGSRRNEFVVHFGGKARSDGRKWGVSLSEQKNMMGMAEAALIQMVAESEAA